MATAKSKKTKSFLQDMIPMEECYVATLLGTAIGDTLGMPVEGWKREQILKHVGRIVKPINPVSIIKDGRRLEQDEFGKLKYYTDDLKKGEYTDDTILSVALAQALIEKGLDLNHVAYHQAKAYQDRGEKPDSEWGYFGYATKQGLTKILQGNSPKETGFLNSVGNAPPMKMAPLGLYIHATDLYEKGLDFAVDVGKITHLDPRSIVSGMLQAYAVSALLDDCSKELFLDDLEFMCSRCEQPLSQDNKWNKSGSILQRMKWIKENPDATVEEAYQEIGVSSAVYRSYPFSIFMLQKYWNEPLEGLIETVNQGGDCDTTGAMYGALAGAKHGMFFPEEWLGDLQNKDLLVDLGKKLYRAGDTHG